MLHSRWPPVRRHASVIESASEIDWPSAVAMCAALGDRDSGLKAAAAAAAERVGLLSDGPLWRRTMQLQGELGHAATYRGWRNRSAVPLRYHDVDHTQPSQRRALVERQTLTDAYWYRLSRLFPDPKLNLLVAEYAAPRDADELLQLGCSRGMELYYQGVCNVFFCDRMKWPGYATWAQYKDAHAKRREVATPSDELAFGKYKGQPMSGIPLAYLRWVMTQCPDRLTDGQAQMATHLLGAAAPASTDRISPATERGRVRNMDEQRHRTLRHQPGPPPPAAARAATREAKVTRTAAFANLFDRGLEAAELSRAFASDEAVRVQGDAHTVNVQAATSAKMARELEVAELSCAFARDEAVHVQGGAHTVNMQAAARAKRARELEVAELSSAFATDEHIRSRGPIERKKRAQRL